MQNQQAVRVDAHTTHKSADTARSVTERARGSISSTSPLMSTRDTGYRYASKVRHCSRGARSDASPAPVAGSRLSGPALPRLNAVRAFPRVAARNAPKAGIGWTPTTRLGAGCRGYPRVPFREAPAVQAGWVPGAMRFTAAPRTGTVTRCTVRLLRSKTLAGAVNRALPQSLKVEACTENKAIASFRVGELCLEVDLQRHEAGAVIRLKGYGLTLNKTAFRPSSGPKVGTGKHLPTLPVQRRGTRRKPFAQSRKQDRLFGYQRTPVKLTYQRRKKSGVFRQ